MQHIAIATVMLVSQLFLPNVVDEVVFVPTIYDQIQEVEGQEKQVEMYLEPIEIKKLPLSKDRFPTRVNEENFGPVINAKSAIVIDAKSGLPLWQKNPNLILPIASLSKLMTALVLLDLELDWEREVELNWIHNSYEGARLSLPSGSIVSLENLFRAMLVGSANNATMALVSATELGENVFVKKMNEKAIELGLENTHFEEPTGLSQINVSTVIDYVKVLQTAFNNERIRNISTQKQHQMETQRGNMIFIKNSNKLVKNDSLDILGSKTGFTYEAGYCLGLMVENDQEQIISLTLLSESDVDRQADSINIANWAFDNYTWP